VTPEILTLDELEALLAKAAPGPWEAREGRVDMAVSNGEPNCSHTYNQRETHRGVAITDNGEHIAGPYAEADAALIAAARNALPDLLKIARAVAKRGPIEPDSYNGLACQFCSGHFDMPEEGFGGPTENDAALTEWENKRAAWEARARAEMQHDPDCVWVIAGGVR
jgi:hypothetical protein